MEPNNPTDKVLIKILLCYEDTDPIQIYQLSAKNTEDKIHLLRHLELFAQFLPYLSEHEKKANAKLASDEMQLRITLDNLKSALQLSMTPVILPT